MVSFNKSRDVPASLGACKSYREADVIDQLIHDFKNKCYICGDRCPTSLNVEHFDEHRGDLAKMYDWFNLFYACGHCNTIKQYTFPTNPSNLLNCTDPLQKVDYWIEYRLVLDEKLRKRVEVKKNLGAVDARFDVQTDNTIHLLDRVYNGTGTAVKDAEAENLLVKLNDEIRRFRLRLLAYMGEQNPETRVKIKAELIEMLSYEAPFAAFKRWIVREKGLVAELPFINASFGSEGLIYCP